MTSETIDRLIGILQDRSEGIRLRLHAASELGATDAPDAIAALHRVAHDESEDGRVARKVGQALAAIYVRQKRILDAPLAEFTGPAYLGFDEAASRLTEG